MSANPPSKSRSGSGPGVLPRDAFALAAGTLTILPTPAPTAINRRVAGWAMVLGPVVMLSVALLAAVAGWLVAWAGAPPLAAGFVTVGLLLAGTRAIHADGLADTVDGLGAAWDRNRALDVMRRGDVGPMGASALIVVLGLQAACLGAILARPLGWALATVLIAGSRVALATGARAGVPPARPEGLGEAVAGSVSWLRWGASWLLVGVAVLFVARATGAPWPAAGAGVVTAALAAEGVLAVVVRRLGGITGDVLGALVEVALTVLLLAASL